MVAGARGTLASLAAAQTPLVPDEIIETLKKQFRTTSSTTSFFHPK